MKKSKSISVDIKAYKNQEMSPRQFLKKNYYTPFTESIYRENFKELNSEKNTVSDIVKIISDTYVVINMLNETFEIRHEKPIDHFLIYITAQRAARRLKSNPKFCFLSTEYLADLAYQKIVEESSDIQPHIYKNENGCLTDFSKTSAHIINDWIYKKGLGQKDFAAACGLSKDFIADFRGGKIQLTKELLFVFAYALKVNSLEFQIMTESLPAAERPDLQEPFDKILIRELDEIPVKSKLPQLSNLNASQYIHWLEAYYKEKENVL